MKRQDFHLKSGIWTKAAALEYLANRYRLVYSDTADKMADALEAQWKKFFGEEHSRRDTLRGVKKYIAKSTEGVPILKAQLAPLVEEQVYYFPLGVPKEDIFFNARTPFPDPDRVVTPLWPYLCPFEMRLVIPNNQPVSKITAWFRHNMKGEVLVFPAREQTYCGFKEKADFVKARLTWASAV